jgi:peptidoglycan/xylan/chitin deacetylase (PgdA/CDA1 family)
MGPTGSAPTVAFTFDDGPGPSTERLLDVLAEHSIKATFFLIGSNIEKYPELAVRMAREGHTLGNHTYGHEADPTPPEFVRSVGLTDALIRESHRRAGTSSAELIPFRLPYGPEGPNGWLRLMLAAGMGRAHVHWTGAFGDWLPRPPAELAVELDEHIRVWSSANLHTVLLLHDAAPSDGACQDRSHTVEGVRLFLGKHRVESLRSLP